MTGLSFFSPAYLWALLFLAVPVAIHFFNRKRIIKLDFSSLRFFRETAVKANRARNIRRLLQLLARMALATVIILLFAKPYNAANPFTILKNPNVTVYYWIDPTISMSYRDGSQSCMQHAQALVDSLGKKLSGTVHVKCFDEQRGEFIDLAGGLSAPAPRYGKSRIEEMYAAFKKEQQAFANPSVLALFSDFQAGTSDAVSMEIGKDTLKTPMLLVSVKPSAVWNAGIRAAEISPENASMLFVRAYARGKTLDAAPVFAMAKGMRIGHSIVSIKQDDSAAIQMEIAGDMSADGGSVHLDRADPFAADNTAWFLARAASQGSILVIGDEKESFPIASAVRSVKRDRTVNVAVKSAEAVTTDDLGNASIIILNGIEYATPILESFLGVSSARKAFIFSPSIKPQAMAFNRQVLARFKQSAVMSADSSAQALIPVLPDTISALWKGFPQKTDKDVAIYRYLRDIPGDVMVRLSNGMPLASSGVDQNGNTWVAMATGLGITEDNNLCETGFFVPFADRIIRHAAAGTATGMEPWIAGIPRQNPYYGRRQGAKIFDAGNRMMATWENQPLVVFENPGLYKIQPFGGPSYWVQAIIDPEETDFHYQAPAGRGNRVKYIDADAFPAFIDSCGNDNLLFVLWILAGLLLLAEVLLWDWGQLRQKHVKS